MLSDEFIPILPGVGLYLSIVSPANPLIHQLADLYIRSFEGWGQALIDSHGRNLALEYLQDYGTTHSGAVLALVLQGQVLGGAVVSFGDKKTVSYNVVNSVAASYDISLDFIDQHFDDLLYDLLYYRLQADINDHYVEISDIFLETRETIKSLITQGLSQIIADLESCNGHFRTESRTHAALVALVYSFKTSRRLNGRSPVHDIYRLFSLCLLLGALVYVQEISAFHPGAITCVQWTCVGTAMHSLFRMLCHPRYTRIATMVDGSLPFVGRVASKIPGDQTFINALINLGKNSEIVWEGPVGDGTRPGVGKIDYNRISVTKFPLDGLIMLVYNWNTYSFFVRRRYVTTSWKYSRNRLRHRVPAR